MSMEDAITYADELPLPVVAVASASCLDALLTLLAIRVGAVEINPFMSLLLSLGPTAFLIVKIVLPSALVSIAWLYKASVGRPIAFAGVIMYCGCCTWTAINLISL